MLIFAACLDGHAVAGTVAATSTPYQLDNTHVHEVHAALLKRDYQLLVALPESYATSQRSYPVLFVTDANYAFPLVRSIAQRLSKHAGLEEAIVVGLSYAKGDTGNYSRRRDYTPSTPRANNYVSDMPGRAAAFGEADAYGRWIADEVFPLVAASYRADMRRKVFVGHSYGSLLGLQVLLTRPATFEHYILGSPSLWYDGGVLFEREAAYAKTHRDLAASVFFGIGGLETGPAGKRAQDDADMVADLARFDAALTARRYPGLAMRRMVFAGEDHASGFPLLFTHGLRSYLKKAR
jgi:predicted alpha/beta superfamily hydrolase